VISDRSCGRALAFPKRHEELCFRHRATASGAQSNCRSRTGRGATCSSKIEGFRFADGRAFDSRGDEDRNLHDRGGTLANSNHRAGKGCEPTFTLKRDFGGLLGRYKLDWMFVSPFITETRRADMSYRFAPHYPLTMRDLNNATEDGISDHAPIAVGLPFEEPE